MLARARMPCKKAISESALLHQVGGRTMFAPTFSIGQSQCFLTNCSNLLLFTVVFSALGLALKSALNLDGYLSAFWYFLAFSEGLGLFDLLVIDLLWWRNTKRIRFSFLPEKKYYQNPQKHIESFWRGIPLFAAAAALSALIVTAF